MKYIIEHKISNPQWNLLQEESCQAELISYPRVHELFMENVDSMS